MMIGALAMHALLCQHQAFCMFTTCEYSWGNMTKMYNYKQEHF